MARHREGVGGRGPRSGLRTATLLPCLVSLATVASVVQQAAQIDRRHVLPLQFGVETAGIGNVGDQPVEPRTSCSITASSRARLFSLRASGSVSTAERSEVSGFFSSCATSAAKASIASMRL